MKNVVGFPGERAVADENMRHAQAFRDLEGDICDCLKMIQVTTRVMPDETDEHLVFTVLQTVEMLERLKKRYYALWKGEERPT
ncbi:hypothetical protein [Bradyrhizobium sp. USDA 4486]